MTQRFQIRIISSSDCKTLGAVISTSNSPTVAAAEGRYFAPDYQYGVAVVDLQEGTVDAGFSADGEELLFALKDVQVND